MDSTQFMGLLIGALATLLGMASIVTAIAIRPIIQLSRNMVKLDDSINNLNKTANGMENRLDKHDMEFNDIHKDLRNMDSRISRVEAQKR